MNTSVRVGNTVRRHPAPSSPFTHRLLTLLERAAWNGAPRLLGTDHRGRGAWEKAQPPAVTSDESLTRIAQLVREFHDLTAATALAGNEEVVCHNDLSPKNTVYQDQGAGLRPVAFIDWDLAAPGRRIHDIAHVCWQYIGLGPNIADIGQAAQQLRLICDAYGLPNRHELINMILWWQDRCWRGITAAATAGNPAMTRLRDAGAVDEVQAAHAWVKQHHTELASHLMP
ncbi:phosphotransferase family protein [Actinomadura meridiana]|uniref:phosphotransferase family protein n=1 Tax=Actinomadura meridiana TaxID=559626 RepID=UPI0031F0E16D